MGSLMQSYVCSLQELETTTSLPKPLKKYPYIDVLRGIAILGVIAVHSSEQNIEGVSKLFSMIFKYGQLGVQLFFVASAITLCLSISGRNEGSTYNFYIRRLFRIAPLYYLGIALYLSWGTLKVYMTTGQFSVTPQYNILGVLTNVFFVHGFYPPANNNIVPGGWSIATEMTFYLLFPYLYWIQLRASNRLFLLFSIFAIGACAIVTFIAYFLWHGSPSFIPGFIYFSIFNQLGVFLIGMYAFRLLHSPKFGTKSILLALALTFFSYLLLNQIF
jgi:peptidoglycan/LPS O-acetylase OafA/YrhL